MKKLTYSLVTTVLNDCTGVTAFFDAMRSQTLLPDEIVIVDGGSKDGTWELLQQEENDESLGVPVVVFQEMGCNVARGRDLAIERSSGGIIVSTDIGCGWDLEWFEELVAPFAGSNGNGIDVVIGSWAVREKGAKSDWARVELALRWPFRLEAKPDSLGINRAISYRKEVWEKVGGYPQDLTLAADDVVFDMLIRQPEYGFKFAAAPIVRCYWERHETLLQFCKEEKRNFFGAGEALIWQKHFVLVTGRLLFEMLCLFAGLLLCILPGSFFLGLLSLSMMTVSLSLRLKSYLKAAERLQRMGVKNCWVRLFMFDYSTRVLGMWGYILGSLNGGNQCRETRKRLRGE